MVEISLLKKAVLVCILKKSEKLQGFIIINTSRPNQEIMVIHIKCIL